jgi:hypothetical protein
MDGYTQFDLLGASYEEFVTFLFDHEVVPTPQNKGRGPEPWYWKAEVLFDPVRVASDYARLFAEPDFLPARFSSSQLEQGFWAIQSCNIECSVAEIIWHKQVPFVMRANCVRSMFHLFEKLFATMPSATAVEMWWDSLAYDWHCGNRSRQSGGEDEDMQDVMFQTLGKILALPEPACQASALHGLGHLHHPETSALIDGYLQTTDGIDPELREYAKAAGRFEVM